MELKKYTRLSMFLSLAIILNIIESFIPFLNGAIPGLKLGLANIVILFVLYIYSFKDALYVSILRVFLVGLLRTGLFSISFWFSLSGAFLSLIMMSLFKKYISTSIIGVSIVGSIFNSTGQILIAIVLLKTTNIIYHLPLLLILSIPTGIIVGMISRKLLEYFENRL